MASSRERHVGESPLIFFENGNVKIIQINYSDISCIWEEFLLFQNPKVEGTSKDLKHLTPVFFRRIKEESEFDHMPKGMQFMTEVILVYY